MIERWRNRITRKERLRIKYFSEDEIARLFAVIDNPRDLLMFRLAYHHGLRASEVGMLRVDDIDLTKGLILIDRLKGSMGGVHALHTDDYRLLKAFLDSTARVVGEELFLSAQRRPVSRFLLDKLMKKYGRLAGLPPEKCHFHALKHSIATHLISRDVGVQFVQDFLGHVDIKNTLLYARLTPTHFEKQTREVFRGMK